MAKKQNLKKMQVGEAEPTTSAKKMGGYASLHPSLQLDAKNFVSRIRNA